MDNTELREMARKRIVGFSALCGLELTEVEPGYAAGRCPLRDELRNPYGFTHGGAINTIMDTLGGTAAIAAQTPLRYVVTRSADVHYLRPVMGKVMYGKARVIRAGRQMCLVQAEIFDEEKQLCATGLLEFYYTGNYDADRKD